MSMIERVWEKARANVRRIALPEGEESRTIQAAARVRDEGLARPIPAALCSVRSRSSSVRFRSLPCLPTFAFAPTRAMATAVRTMPTVTSTTTPRVRCLRALP